MRHELQLLQVGAALYVKVKYLPCNPKSRNFSPFVRKNLEHLSYLNSRGAGSPRCTLLAARSLYPADQSTAFRRLSAVSSARSPAGLGSPAAGRREICTCEEKGWRS